jgi:hypothetical protein
MKNHKNRVRGPVGALLVCLGVLTGNSDALASDGAQFISNSIPAGTQMMPRTVFTQTVTMQNTGTTTWTPGESGYTLNLVGTDSLGAVPLIPITSGTWYLPCASISGGQSVAPNQQATFCLTFIAPEAAGSVSDTFQMSSASGVSFGQQVTVQIVVKQAGSTSQYDRARAVSYANNYAGYVCSDGYFWTNGSGYGTYGNHAALPAGITGDDCAHFVSCCIGSQSAEKGGGLPIPSRATPTYGEPGAQRLIYTVLVAGGYATEVSSLNSMCPGDVIGWNWEGETSTNLIDHVTFYLGNGLLASHADSHLDVSATTYYPSGSVHHYIHIFDAPTVAVSRSGNNLVLSWGTNWTGYSLYSATSLSPNATWSKVSTSPKQVGALNMWTNTSPAGNLFYRLVLP